MNVSLVAQNKEGLAWLQWLLAPELAEHHVQLYYVGDIQSSAISTARSILSEHLSPVILIVDSDTTDAAKIAEEEPIIRNLLGMVAP